MAIRTDYYEKKVNWVDIVATSSFLFLTIWFLYLGIFWSEGVFRFVWGILFTMAFITTATWIDEYEPRKVYIWRTKDGNNA